jgi:uncharacterized protein with HEPN domain
MRRDPRAHLWDAVAALDSISAFVHGRSLADYESDELLRSAVERKFEIVGEALNQLSKVDGDLAARVPGLRQIVGFRNILIHGYAHVDDALVWQAVEGAPELRDVLAALLHELGGQAPG